MNAAMNRLRVDDVLKVTAINRSQLAKELGITREAVYQWGDYIPQKRLSDVYELMGRCLQNNLAIQTRLAELEQQKTPTA